jgi:hypothetical protein
MTFLVRPGRDLPGVFVRSGRSSASARLDGRASANAMTTAWNSFIAQPRCLMLRCQPAHDRFSQELKKLTLSKVGREH